MPDIIEAASFEPTDPDYMSEEDPTAIYQSSRPGRPASIVYGTAERLIRANDKSERKLQVPSLHIEDQIGTVWVRRFEPAKPPLTTQLQGDVTYVQPLQSRPGQSAQRWVEYSCGDIVCVVDMVYPPEHDVYTLVPADQKGVAEWLKGQLQREAAPLQPIIPLVAPIKAAKSCALPRPQAGPKTYLAKQAQKDVRRSARLAGKVIIDCDS